MIEVSFDVEMLRTIIREEVQTVVNDAMKNKELPLLLTRTQMMEFLQISHSKAAELIARPDFPVFREAGLFIPRDRLLEWIDQNTRRL